MFLDISKAFDKVWHDGLLFKLKNYGVSGSLFTIIIDFLANRQQRVVLNGKSSSQTLKQLKNSLEIRSGTICRLILSRLSQFIHSKKD